MMKRAFSILLVVMVLLPFGALAEEKNTVSINYWSWVDSNWKAIMVELLDTFQEKNPDITLDFDTYSCAYADVMPNLLVQGPAGNTPDLSIALESWVPQLQELGVLADLSKVLPAELTADYTAGLDNYYIDGELVALPYLTQGRCMFYNKDLFEKAGITQLPKTFDEVLAAAEKIAALGSDENGNKIYGLGLVNSQRELAEGYNVFPWLWARGGDFVDADNKIVLNSQENLKAYQEIADLFARDISPKGLSFKEMRNLFGTGLLGMYWDQMSQTASFAAASTLGEEYLHHIGAFNIPGATEGTFAGYNDNVMLVMFKSCENAEAAAKVIDFLTGADTIGLFDRHGKGKMSGRASVMSEVFNNVENPVTMAYVEAAATNRNVPATAPHFSEADEAINRSLTRLAQGEDPASVLAEVAEEITELYAQ